MPTPHQDSEDERARPFEVAGSRGWTPVEHHLHLSAIPIGEAAAIKHLNDRINQYLEEGGLPKAHLRTDYY